MKIPENFSCKRGIFSWTCFRFCLIHHSIYSSLFCSIPALRLLLSEKLNEIVLPRMSKLSKSRYCFKNFCSLTALLCLCLFAFLHIFILLSREESATVRNTCVGRRPSLSKNHCNYLRIYEGGGSP